MLQATGHVGKYITEALLSQGKHTVTVITRPDSKGDIPAEAIVKRVDYSPSSLVDALKGQDALVITLNPMAPKETQHKLIDAAAAAGVRFVLPNEWGSDTVHPAINKNPVLGDKAEVREYVEKVGKSAWIALINNQWYEWSLGTGGYGIDIPNRKAHLYDDGSAKTVTTTWPQVGRAVAKLLALPVSGQKPSLEEYSNKHVYVSSFYLSQRDMLDAVQRCTGTTDKDWTFTSEPAQEALDSGYAELSKGDFRAIGKIIYAGNFVPDGGNDYVNTKQTLNKPLGLPEEDLHKATEDAIEYSKQPQVGY